MDNIPNMIGEILETIHLMYEDYPDVETDCLLFLQGLHESPELLFMLKNKATNALIERMRCPNCGNVLKTYHYKEIHDELPERPSEDMYDLYCPVCDLGKVGCF